MIATIDEARRRHNEAISEAMRALADLAQVTKIPVDEIQAAYLDGMAAVDVAADAAIERQSSRQRDEEEARTVYHVEGDMIQVGDIVDSSSVAVGKEIDQSL